MNSKYSHLSAAQAALIAEAKTLFGTRRPTATEYAAVEKKLKALPIPPPGQSGRTSPTPPRGTNRVTSS